MDKSVYTLKSFEYKHHMYKNRKPDKKSETRQKNRKIPWMNQYVNKNSPVLKLFRFDHQEYKNWKPDNCPGNKFARSKITHMLE